MTPLSIVMLSAMALAGASDVFAQGGKPIGAEEGCDTTCRFARNNPKPKFISPEVGADGKVTVRVYAPKANSVGIGGLEPLNESGDHALIDFPGLRQQRVADPAIAVWRGGIDGQQQSQVSLIHLVNAQDA